MNTTNKNTEKADTDASSAPTPDFGSLRSAAATYRMFGATPVPLVNRPLAESKDEKQCRFKAESPSRQPTSDQTGGEVDWERADGIGVLARKNGWNGLLVEPMELKAPIFNLRMSDTAWVARNDRSALIYLRTDASRDILRAVAAIYQEAMSPRFTAAASARHFGGPDGPAVLPVPPKPGPDRWSLGIYGGPAGSAPSAASVPGQRGCDPRDPG